MQYALITGANSGLGKAVAETLLKDGFYVFAADIRHTFPFPRPNFIPITMDVSSSESVTRAFVLIQAKTKTLDVVANFAGVVVLGSLIEKDPEEMLRIMNIGLVGMMRVNQEAFPMVERAHGRFINVSSEYGLIPAVPFHSFYTATKHAVEVYSDGLRKELLPFDVRVILIRPGAFKTDMQQGVQGQFEGLVKNSRHYPEALKKMERMMAAELTRAKNPALVANLVLKIVHSKHPRRTYNINHSLKMKLIRCLPLWLQDRFFSIFY